MTLPRGFKAAAEKQSAELRADFGLKSYQPIDIVRVADSLGITVIPATDLIEQSRLEEIERLQAYAFSACTLELAERTFVIINPLHSPSRRNSDLAHEIAHVLLAHDLTEIRELAGTPFRTCRADQEEEATAFAGTLLLPRPLLLKAAKAGLGWKDVAEEHQVTTAMARYRWNTTGVERQVGASHRRSSRA